MLLKKELKEYMLMNKISINVIKINLPNYIDLMKEWKNTKEQQQLLINYI